MKIKIKREINIKGIIVTRMRLLFAVHLAGILVFDLSTLSQTGGLLSKFNSVLFI